MSRSTRFLFFSALIHTILVMALWWTLNKKHPSQNLVQIEFIKPTGEEISPHTTGSKNAGGLAKGHGNGFAQYLPQYHFDSSISNSGMERDTYLNSPHRDNPNSTWGSGSETFQRISDYNFYQMLYNQVDGSLFYPGVLSRNHIKGTINARIVIAATGDCNWQMTKIQGPDPYLSLYVLDVLKNVCKMNFKKYMGQKEIANADLSFQFDINEDNDRDRVDSNKIIVGNTLLFYRNSHQSIAEWELGPFKGMFPVPAVYLNIPWLQENWERVIHKKDPLSEFKRQFGEG